MKKLCLFLVGLLCVIPFPDIAAQVAISEIFYDTPLYEKMKPRIGMDTEGIHHNGEYIELYNYSAATVDLSGFSIGVVRHGYQFFQLPQGTVCKSKECIIVAFRHPNSPEFQLKELFPKISVQEQKKIFYQSLYILGNNGNIVILRDTEGRIMSEVQYYRNQAVNNREPYLSVHNKNLLCNRNLWCSSVLDSAPANPFKYEDVDGYDRTLGEMMPTERCNVADKEKTVGEIKANASVSPSGAAIMEVPLVFPPGINGMEPKLSVQYNSQGGVGALGVATELTGLSAISRSNENIYFDGKRSVLKFQKGGPYIMDGQKLVQVTPGKYETYIYSLTKIEEVGISGNGPLYFRVTSPQGIVAEYGSELSGRVYASDNTNILAWKISKVTDLNGNCIIYKYTTEKEKGSYIKEIVYGENSRNKIEFNYIENKVTPSAAFVDGSFFYAKMLLSGIQVNAGASRYLKYGFNYSDDRLADITENGINGEKLSLDCTWGSSGRQKVQKDILYASEMDGATFVSGDLNGDGQLDLARLCTHKKENYLEPFIKENGEFTGKQALYMPDNVSDDKNRRYINYQLYNCLDINNDGKSELLIMKFEWHNERYSYSLSAYSYSNGNLSFIKEVIQATDYNADPEIKPVILNTNKNIPEIAFIYKNGSYLQANFNQPITSMQVPAASLPLGNIEKALTIDYNSDGISELLVRSNEEWYLISFNSSAKINLLSDKSFVSAEILDINNDGLDDIIFVSKNAKLKCFVNKGNQIFAVENINVIPDKLSNEFGSNDNQVQDVNIYQTEFDGGRGSELTIRFNTKIVSGVFYDYKYNYVVQLNKTGQNLWDVTGWNRQNKWERQTLFADLNEDGIADLAQIQRGNVVSATKTFSGKKNLLMGIHNNGINRASFEYGYASDKKLHSCPDNDTPSAIKYLNIPYPLAASLSQPNGTGGRITTMYKYFDGKFHTEGLGALGFGKVEQTIKTGGISRMRSIETVLDNTTFLTKSQTSKSYVNKIECESQTVDIDINKSPTGKTVYVQKKSENAYNILEGSQKRTDYTYDSAKRLSCEKVTYDDNSYVKTDYSGYNAFNQPRSIYVTRKHFQDAAPFYERTRNLYDDKSNLTTSISFLYSSAAITTNYTYYSNGLVKSKKTTAQGVEPVEESYAYEMGGTRSKITKTNAFSITNSYYNLLTGNLEEEAITLKGIITPQTTRYIYDGLGREKQVIYPNGKKMEKELSWDTDRRKYYYKTVEKMTGESPVTKWFDVLGREIYSSSKERERARRKCYHI